jgi:hypothetical protein
MKIYKLLLLCLLTVASFAEDFSSPQYLALPAKEKMNKLWAAVTEDKTSAVWYSARDILGIFTEDLHITFQEPGDVLPNGRKKLIHTVGSIAQAEFIPVPNTPYTGIYDSGNKNVLLRYSVAKETVNTSPPLGNFAPGISIKFLVDGKQSCNLVAMYSTSGQDSWNPFKYPFTPQFDISDNSSIAEKLLAAKFSKVTHFISSMGNRELSLVTETGGEAHPNKFPFKLMFRPNPVLTAKYPDFYELDLAFKLRDIEVGTMIYEVYAIEEPGCDEQKIGEIKITSNFTTSKFADEKLFFKHSLPDDDMSDYPQFGPYKDQWGFIGKYPAQKAIPRHCPFKNLFGL